LAATALLMSVSGVAFAQIGGGGVGRLVDIVEVNEHDDQVDINVQFNCSVRYVTHLPASEGVELRVQLQPLPDCRVAPGVPIMGEIPPLSGGAGILSAVRVDSDVPGQITLVLDFKKSEQFVLAQGVDPRGLRVRIIRPISRKGQILLT